MNERVSVVVDWAARLGREFTRTRAALVAGGLAYFVALSIVPAAIGLGALAGLILDPADVRTALESLVARTPGAHDQAQSAINVLVGLVESSSAGAFTVTTIVSVIVAVYASSKVVLGVRMAMNTTFGVVDARSGLVERAIAAVFTLLGLVVAVGIVVLLTAVPRVVEWLGVDTARTSSGSWLLDWIVVLMLVYLAVRWVIQHAPNGGTRVPWSSPGLILAALWIVAVTAGVGVYAHFSSSLGAAVLVLGTAVVVLLWLYLCFLGLIWGASIEADRQRDEIRRRTSEADQQPAP